MLEKGHVWFSDTHLVIVQSLRSDDSKYIFKSVEMLKNLAC